jgi:hypothetical protein
MNGNTYFAADKPEACVATLIRKGNDWFNILLRNRYIEKIRRSWYAYHGAYYSDGHDIVFAGEQGELANIAINHYRNLAQHMLNMVTANRPTFQASCINTDYKSQSQVYLAHGLLDYYMREKRLEVFLKRAVEYAIVLGTGYIKMEWDSTKGETVDVVDEEIEFEGSEDDLDDDEELIERDGVKLKLKKYPIKEGDVVFTSMSPYDVVFDTTKETPEEQDWVLCRTFKNKFALAAKYPEFAEQIKELKTKDSYHKYRMTITAFDETSDVPVYEFFHKKDETLPEGRYTLYLDGDIILMDTNMPYDELPIYRISPSDILGTSYGYTSMFDLLPMQDSVNSLYSTILTNQSTFGVQSIISPRGSDVSVNMIDEGMSWIEYNPMPGTVSGGKPESMNLTSTPGEIFNFLQMLEKAMETVSGINSVTRGNPESSLKSGTALALIQAQSLQFMSGLQSSYVRLIEDVGTGLINLLKNFATTPRVAAIAGVNNQTKVEEFKGEDLSSIRRVNVEVGNPLAHTTAGKVQMAEQMLQMFGDRLTPEQYFSIINTGRLETMTGGVTNEMMLIKDENENLVSNAMPVQAVFTETHMTHIKEHRNVLADVAAKNNPEIIMRVQTHIQEHVNLLRTTDPDLLSILGQQPLGPQGGSPVSPETAGSQTPNQQGAGGLVTEQPQQQQGANPNASVPQPAQPAQSPDGNPVLASDVPLQG